MGHVARLENEFAQEEAIIENNKRMRKDIENDAMGMSQENNCYQKSAYNETNSHENNDYDEDRHIINLDSLTMNQIEADAGNYEEFQNKSKHSKKYKNKPEEKRTVMKEKDMNKNFEVVIDLDH